MNMPQIEPVTGLSRDYKMIFAKLEKGPVFLAQRSKPAAVLLSVRDYEQMVERLKQLELLVEAKRILAEMERDPSSVVSLDELKRQLTAKVTA
jgi:PHD/YefM family antitoxin component YafN of YafNO toxin-antitoxin module